MQPVWQITRSALLLEDVEVLSVLGENNGQGRPILTLLVGPQDADRLSLADATMQVRVVLRKLVEAGAITPAEAEKEYMDLEENTLFLHDALPICDDQWFHGKSVVSKPLDSGHLM